MTKAIIVDTEVNSLFHKEPIEVAWAEYDCDNGQLGKVQSKRFRPVNPIEAGAAIVHGILLEDLEDCPPSSEAKGFVPEAEYWIGHNIDFDAEVLGNTVAKRICTLALSQHIWPQYGCHKLTALIYERFGMTSETRKMIDGAHSAAPDVEFVADLLSEIRKEKEAESRDSQSLYDFCETARIPTVMRVGKHKGELIRDLPRDYKAWFLRQSDVDPYLRKALQR